MTIRDDGTRPYSTDLRGVQLIGVIVLSLGLWVAIWDVFASAFSAVFR
jgi:hypothetical protein